LATALLNALGLPPLCVPLDTAPQCSPTVPVPAAQPQSGQTFPPTATPTTITPPTSVPRPPVTTPPTIVPPITLPPITVPGLGPVDSMIGLLSSPAGAANAQMAAFVVPYTAPSGHRSSGGLLGWIRQAARSVTEAIT
jgi:hypothetical protein